MSYSWEEVMLGIDVRREAKQKQKDIEKIEAKAKKEQDMMSAWSLGLSILGGALFGPAGYMIGKQVGTYGADLAYDWESETVDVGKFNKDQIEEFNKSIKTEAASQTQGQLLGTAIDLATMYVQAGGLQEGFEGWSDLTTFGTGEDAWTMFGEGTLVDKIPGAKTLPGDQSIFAGGGTPIWKKGGFKQLSENLKKGNLQGAWATDQSINTIADLGRLAMSYQESEEEEPKGSTFGTLQNRQWDLS